MESASLIKVLRSIRWRGLVLPAALCVFSPQLCRLWTLYDAASGERLGQVKSHVRYAPFFVTGMMLVTVSGPELRQTGQGTVAEPLQIKALDLTTGELAWTQPIRDTVNRLPPPP